MRDYAAIIGLDRDETVDEFCRVTPNGDRRGYRVLKQTAEVLGHELVWRDDLPPDVNDGDRRTVPPPEQREIGAWFYSNLRRLVAGADLIAVIGLAAGAAAALRLNWWTTIAVSALVYYTVGMLLLGSSLTLWAVDAYFSAHRPLERHRAISVFRGLDLMAGKNPTPDHRAAD